MRSCVFILYALCHLRIPAEIREALINPSSKANKRKRDDVALEEQVSWVVVLERDLPEDDPEDVTYEVWCSGGRADPLLRGKRVRIAWPLSSRWTGSFTV